MPLLTLWQLPCEGGEVVDMGPLSCEDGETFHKFREKLNDWQLFTFEYDFWDVRLCKRMLRVMERGNKIQDHGFKVTVIPSLANLQMSTPVLCNVLNLLDPNLLPATITQSIHLSSNASNDPVSQPANNLDDSQLVENFAEQIVHFDPSQAESGLPSIGNSAGALVESGAKDHEDFRSKLLHGDLVSFWRVHIRKCELFMKDMNKSDHRWIVRTWDVENEAQADIFCQECDQPFSGSSKGVMDKSTITNCFINFKSSHVDTNKHHGSWCRKRNLPNDRESKKKVKRPAVDEKVLVNQGLRIVETINEEESVNYKETFIILGDLERVPCLSLYYKVKCAVCGELMSLVPHQRNLEHNLRSHVLSFAHLKALHNSTGKGGALLTGKPGRPSVIDKRDTKQKTIHTFFGHDLGRDGQSSSSKGTSIPDLSLSLLCWGMWKDSIPYNGVNRSVKALLDDQVMGAEWWCEPHLLVSVYNPTSESIQSIQGTFRHRMCSRVSHLGGGFIDLICEICYDVPGQTDFRLRVFREEQAPVKHGERDTGKGRRLTYLNNVELRTQARTYVRTRNFDRKTIRRCLARICMLQAKVPTLRGLIGESENRKDVYKFCTTIVHAHQRGLFGGKSAVWDWLKDIVFNLGRPSPQGNRYSKGTKVINQALLQHGGRHVIDCLHMNMLGPSLNTLQRDRRGMVYFRTGYHVPQFQLISRVYAKIKEKLGIHGDVPCMLAEDETSIRPSVRWLAKYDVLIGFCGGKVNSGGKHVCECGVETKVGSGEEGFETIMSSFLESQIGHMARAIIVNPLHESFPAMCVLATTTCNSFRSPWVRHQWEQLLGMWNEYYKSAVGPVIGHASDGDPRRRHLMLEDYRGEGITLTRQSLGWAGWTLTHSWLFGHAYGLHDQDFIHNLKKLINPLDSPTRVLHLGATIVTIAHLLFVYELYTVLMHGLNHDDLLRTDRQNWASAQRLCSRKVIACLKLLRERQDARVEMSLGTELYLSICADYLDIFQNVRKSLRERVVLCAKVSFFFRLWRLWLTEGNDKVGGNQQPLNLANMISMEAFHDIQISCHYVVLLIVLFRDKYPYLPVPLHLVGSDCCEQFFSKVGGMKGHERNYDFAEMVDAASGLNRLAELEMSEGVLSVGKSHKKYKNLWMKMHPLEEGEVVADLADFSDLRTNEMVIAALKEGFEEAQKLCTELQMCPTTSEDDFTWWNEPWLKEVELDYESEYVADDGSDGLENLINQMPSEYDNVHSDEIDTPVSQSDDAEIVEDGVSDIVVAQGELRHVISELFHEASAIQNVDVEEIANIFEPTVQFDNRSVYKSTLVSQLVGNPKLSKDRLIKVRQSIYFNSLVDKPKDREGAPSMPMWIGSDIGVFFIEPTTQVKTRSKSGPKKGKSARASSSTSVARPRLLGEKNTWYIGRVQFIKKRYGKRWGRAREKVDLLDRPVGKEGEEGSVCDILCNWFAATATKGKFKYSIVDPLWVNLESVISTVSMRVQPSNPSMFILDTSDMRRIEEFVKSQV